MAGTSRPEDVSTKRQRIAELARKSPEMAFTTLAHFIDIDWILTAHGRTRKDGAVGVDGQTADDYAVDLEGNLQNLLDRAKSGTYVAPPVRRVHIPKAGSATRLGRWGYRPFVHTAPLCNGVGDCEKLGPIRGPALVMRPTAGTRSDGWLTQAGDDLGRQPDPPGAVRRRLDPVQDARLTPIRDCGYRYVEHFRGDLRGASPIRPVTIGARRGPIGTATRDRVAIS